MLNSTTTVEAEAGLVDTRTGTQLWDGRGFAQNGGSNGSGNIVAALVAAAPLIAAGSRLPEVLRPERQRRSLHWSNRCRVHRRHSRPSTTPTQYW